MSSCKEYISSILKYIFNRGISSQRNRRGFRRLNLSANHLRELIPESFQEFSLTLPFHPVYYLREHHLTLAFTDYIDFSTDDAFPSACYIFRT